ncbi:MAG: hypothetical protein WDA27_10755 [Actinomycetota bacterium]
MPAPDDTPTSCRDERVVRRVLAYAPPLRSSDFDGVRYEGTRRPARTTTSRSDGTYKLVLTAGLYTILVEEEGTPTLGAQCEKGTFCVHARVRAGATTRVDLGVDEAAY